MLPLPPSLLPFALAAFSGGAYALAFPPFSLPGIALLSLAPLFVACARLSPARAALAGLLWTSCAAAALGHWLPATIARFFEVPVGTGWLALGVLAWLPAGLPIAGCCAWLAWAGSRGGAGPLSVGAAFGLTELARSSAWPPLPYAPLASAALPDAFAQCVDALGVFGLGMLVAALNGAVAEPLAGRRCKLREVAAVALLALAAYGYGQLGPEPEATTQLRVAAVQPGVATRLPDPSSPEAVRRHGVALVQTRALRGAGHDLVVWPEHSVGFYLRDRTPARESVLALSRELDADLVLGGPHYRYAEPELRYFASAFLLSRGELRGRHDKTRLVPIAEVDYASGERLRPLSGARAEVGALVCAEILFPEVARALVRAGATILVNPSNDAWLVPAAAEHMLRLAQLRAIENRRPLVRSTPTGVSAVIDERGRVLARSQGAGPEVVEATVRPGRAITLVQRFGDWPGGLAGLWIGCVTLRKRRSHA